MVMIRNNFRCHLRRIFLFVAILTFISCNKNQLYDKEDLIGIWKSPDSSYKLEFKTDNDFLRNGDHYNYWLMPDSIKIQYSGILYILIKPTTHSYNLKRNILTIDFRSGCYGFDSEILKFIRE